MASRRSLSRPCLKPEQLDALVAPIALYPDALLANLLAASTYPLEVVQADRWLDEHKKLKGDALKTEVDKQGWDDSVKALAGTPSVLSMMSDKLDWTKDLGDAVLAQQPDVMDAIQRLRSTAHDNNKLVSTKEQKVTVQQQENKQVIVIEPTDPNTVYVPYYEPAVVYGEWPYPDYPPYYFAAPPYIGAGLIATGLAFGAGYALGRWGNYWGGGCNWGNNNFFINRPTTSTISATTGSTIRLTARASATTTPASSRNSATTTCEPAPQTGWTSAAATASKCSTLERTVPARVIVPGSRGADRARRRPRRR